MTRAVLTVIAMLVGVLAVAWPSGSEAAAPATVLHVGMVSHGAIDASVARPAEAVLSAVTPHRGGSCSGQSDRDEGATDQPCQMQCGLQRVCRGAAVHRMPARAAPAPTAKLDGTESSRALRPPITRS